MTPKYFDVHTHLNMLGANWHEVGKRTIDGGVWFVSVGADEKSSGLALEQAKELGDGIWATAGIHPTEVCHSEASGEGWAESSDFEVIRDLAKDEKIVAIGECGLEYFRIEDKEVKKKQRELFIKHIELALEVGKPLMIHCRASQGRIDAYDNALEILKSYKDQAGDRLRFNFHFFTGDWLTAQKILELGGYLSFPGVITFSPLSNEKNLTGQTDPFIKVVRKMSLDKIMAETDAPFATPVPHRGKQNEPAFVQFVAERIADLRPEPREEVLATLVKNAIRFYNIK